MYIYIHIFNLSSTFSCLSLCIYYLDVLCIANGTNRIQICETEENERNKIKDKNKNKNRDNVAWPWEDLKRICILTSNICLIILVLVIRIAMYK